MKPRKVTASQRRKGIDPRRGLVVGFVLELHAVLIEEDKALGGIRRVQFTDC